MMTGDPHFSKRSSVARPTHSDDAGILDIAKVETCGRAASSVLDLSSVKSAWGRAVRLSRLGADLRAALAETRNRKMGQVCWKRNARPANHWSTERCKVGDVIHSPQR